MPRDTLNTQEVQLVMLSIERMLDRDLWKLRGRTACSCGGEALYRCTVCPSPNLCKTCLLSAHIAIPFHDVMEWSERAAYFTRTTLRDLGLRIPLGHGRELCPQGRPERLEAITEGGVKSVGVIFCCCEGAPSDKEQVKARGWWPMRSNFVSALSLEVLDEILAADPESEAEAEAEASDSDSDSSGSDSDVSGSSA
ncbi:hypothetical protein B0H13DRAFT_2337910 [Mycena leptocephala]|nr:hypothetical protein B0H13DRAFT_2337910 [Mycena leptocephala]